MRIFPRAVRARESAADAGPSERSSGRGLPYSGCSRCLSLELSPLRHLFEWNNARGDRAATSSRAVREFVVWGDCDAGSVLPDSGTRVLAFRALRRVCRVPWFAAFAGTGLSPEGGKW